MPLEKYYVMKRSHLTNYKAICLQEEEDKWNEYNNNCQVKMELSYIFLNGIEVRRL